MAAVLVATSDARLSSTVVSDAESRGVAATWVATSDLLLHAVDQASYDLVVLDDRLADRLEPLVRELTKHGCGVLVVRHRASSDALSLLDAGADDAVCGESLPELCARVWAILRRRTPPPRVVPARVSVGAFELHPRTRLVVGPDRRVHVSPLEMAVLLALEARDGAPVSRGVLLQECWPGAAAPRPDSVDAVMRRLRVRLEVHPARPRHLVTVRGMGYALRG